MNYSDEDLSNALLQLIYRCDICLLVSLRFIKSSLCLSNIVQKSQEAARGYKKLFI